MFTHSTDADMRETVAECFGDACQSNDMELITLALKSGLVDLQAHTKMGFFPLFLAMSHPSLVTTLLEAKAAVNQRHRDQKTSPLYIGCESGWMDTVRLVLAAKGDPNLPNKEGMTCLHAAAKNGRNWTSPSPSR